METLTIIVICLLLIYSIVITILFHKLNQKINKLENYTLDLNTIISDYYQKIKSLFDMSIHYYDETIFEFIESTKELKNNIDDCLSNNDMQEAIIEITEEEQPKEVLGVVKHGIMSKRTK